MLPSDAAATRPRVRLNQSDPGGLDMWEKWGRLEWWKAHQLGGRSSSVGVEVSEDGFGAGADLELAVDLFEVVAEGFVADVEFCGGFLGDEALGEAVEDLAFAWCEGGEGDGWFGGHGGPLAECFDDHGGDVRAEWGAAGSGGAEAGDDFGRGSAFDEIAVSACAEGGEDAFGLVVDCQDDEGGGWEHGGESAETVFAGDAWEFEVDDDDIGGELCEFWEGVFAGGP